MEKTFDVDGIAKIVLIYRGSTLIPNKRFRVLMNENEFNTFKPFIEIIDVKEVTDSYNIIHEQVIQDNQKSESMVENNNEEEVKENIIEEVEKSDKPRNRTNSKSKR